MLASAIFKPKFMTIKKQQHAKGFTLIEVMVALTIIAISLGALLNTSGTQANSVSYLKQKSFAHWVALNEMTQLRIEKAFPSVGEKTGSSDMAGHQWYWTRTTIKTEDDDARQVEFRVFLDEDYEQNLTRLIGYVSK